MCRQQHARSGRLCGLSLCERMKIISSSRAWVVATLLSLFASQVCRSDEFSNFLQSNNLRINLFLIETNESGFQAQVQLVGVNTTNYSVEGVMVLDNTEKKLEHFKRFDAEMNQQRQKYEQKRSYGTDYILPVTWGDIGREEYGWITKVRLLNSDRITRRFPDASIASVYCLDVIGNQVLVARPMIVSTNEGDFTSTAVFILGNAPTVAAYITKYKMPVHTMDEARETLDIFAELQTWTICREMPEEVLGWNAATNQIWVSQWKYQEKESEIGWRFAAVFLVDPQIKEYVRGEVEIFRDGSVTFTNMMHMGSSGGYL